MTLQDFRINHSKLIEKYQFIEARLEAIYSRNCADTFVDGLRDVESDTIKRVVGKISRYEAETGIVILPQDIRQRLDAMLPGRNYYVHECYWYMAVIKKDGVESVKRDSVAQDLMTALRDAEELDDDIYHLSLELDKTAPEQPFGKLPF